MTVSKRFALGVSVGVIFIYWIHQLVTQHGAPPLPAHFSDPVLPIARNKLIVFAAMFLGLNVVLDFVMNALIPKTAAAPSRNSSGASS